MLRVVFFAFACSGLFLAAFAGCHSCSSPCPCRAAPALGSQKLGFWGRKRETKTCLWHFQPSVSIPSTNSSVAFPSQQ